MVTVKSNHDNVLPTGLPAVRIRGLILCNTLNQNDLEPLNLGCNSVSAPTKANQRKDRKLNNAGRDQLEDRVGNVHIMCTYYMCV